MVLLFLLCGRKGCFLGEGVHYTGLFGAWHLKDLPIITVQPAMRVVTP